MSEHFHAVVWLDHREARIFRFNATEAEGIVLHPDRPTHHLHHKAGVIGSGHAGGDQDFYHRIAEALADAGAILVTGPANAKTEFVKHIEHHDPALKKKIVAVETLDHPTSGELVRHAREKFARDHMLPPRSQHN